VPFGVRLHFWHGLPGALGSDGNIMDLHWQLQEQLKREHNLVVFSGPRLLASIHEYRWYDASGASDEADNPYFGMTIEELERIRLEERQRRGLGLAEATALGLLSEDEKLVEFRPRVAWVRDRRGGSS
jgi:hypothetical protein